MIGKLWPEKTGSRHLQGNHQREIRSPKVILSPELASTVPPGTVCSPQASSSSSPWKESHNTRILTTCFPGSISAISSVTLSPNYYRNYLIKTRKEMPITTSCLSSLYGWFLFPLLQALLWSSLYADVKIIFHCKVCNDVLMNNSLCFYRNEPVMGCCVLTGENKVAEIRLQSHSHKTALARSMTGYPLHYDGSQAAFSSKRRRV